MAIVTYFIVSSALYWPVFMHLLEVLGVKGHIVHILCVASSHTGMETFLRSDRVERDERS